MMFMNVQCPFKMNWMNADLKLEQPIHGFNSFKLWKEAKVFDFKCWFGIARLAYIKVI